MSSKTVDQRVVSMQFDNSNFEKNVSTTMSTLEKFKRALHLDGATKGLENVNSAANKMDFSKAEFAATKAGLHIKDVFEKTTRFLEDDIARRIIDVGKKIVTEFTIAPITSGFSEYELKMGSVQTIMASTGESLETVNQYLEELNKYSDQTIYSFSDMTSNIGKFTNAGVKLKDAVAAIKGVSNAAALSGANANEASRAMYNFAQALSTGYVKLIDWKSIENANMATVEFKNQLIKTGLELGTLRKEGDRYVTTTTNMQGKISAAFDATHNFNEALENQWMTTEVLTATLGRYADETTDIGKRATEAATEVKTFSMMMDTLKEAAQSGWAETWELIFGDFNEAKSLWTELSNTFGDMIAKSSEARNEFLRGALDSNWEKFTAQINDAGIATEDFAEKLKETAKEEGIAIEELEKKHGSLINVILSGELGSDIFVKTLEKFAAAEGTATTGTEDLNNKLEEFQSIVDRVLKGEFSNGEERVKALTDAGYDYAEIQALVNKSVDGYRLTLEDLSDTQLESIGYTKEEISTIRELADEAKKAGTPLNELIENMYKPSGRELMILTLRNALESIQNIIGAFSTAWHNVFGKADSGVLYNIIEKLYELSETFKINEERADQLRRIFEGLFSILSIIKDVISFPIKLAFNVLSKVLDNLGIDILEIAASIGDAITKFKDWFDNNEILVKGLEILADIISRVIKRVKTMVNSFLELPIVQEIFSKISEVSSAFFDELGVHFSGGGEVIKAFIERVKDMDGISFENIKSVLKDFKDNVLGYFFDIDGKFENTAKYFKTFSDNITSASEFASNAFSKFKEVAVTVIDTLKEKLSNINIGSIFAIAMGSGLLLFCKELATVLNLIGKPIKAFMNFAEGINSVLNGVAKAFKSMANLINAKALETVAKSIAILVGALILLALIPSEKIWPALGVIAALGVLVTGIMFVMSLVAKNTATVGKASIGFAGIGTCLLMMAFAIKIIGGLSIGEVIQGGSVLMAFAVVVGVLAFVANKCDRLYGKLGALTELIQQLGKTMLLIAAFCVIVGLVSWTALGKAGAIAGSFTIMTLAFVAITKLTSPDKIEKAVDLIKGVSKAMLLVAAFCAIVGLVSVTGIIQSVIIMAVFGVFCSVLIGLTSKYKPTDVDKAGDLILKVAGAMVLVGIACKICEKLDGTQLWKGALVLVGLGTLCWWLITLTQEYDGKEVSQAGSLILKVSAAMLILSGAIAIISILNPEGVFKGILAIAGVSVCIGMLIAIANGAKASKNLPMVLNSVSACIAILAISIAALAMIDPLSVGVATLAMMGVMSMLSILFIALREVLKNESIFKSTNILLLELMAIIGILGFIIYKLAKIENPMNVLASAAALSTVLIGLAVVCKLINKMQGDMAKAMTSSVTIVSLSASLLIICSGLLILSNMNTEGILPKLAILAGIVASLGVICILVNKLSNTWTKVIPGLIAMTVVCGLMVGMTIALQNISLGWSDLEDLAIGLIAIGGALLVVAGAALLMQKLGANIAILTMASGFGVFAAAAVMFSLSIYVVIECLTLLANIGAEKVNEITETVKALLNSFITNAPLFVKSVATLIVSICQSIINAAPKMAEAVVTLVKSTVAGLVGTIPTIVEGLFTLLTSILTTLAEYAPTIFQAVMDIIIGVLTSIRNNIYEVVTIIVDVILQAIAAIRDKIPDIIQAAIDFIFALIEGLGQAIEDNAERLRETMISFCEHIWNAILEFFGIHSPSRKMGEVGVNLMEGLINGIGGMIGGVVEAVVDVGGEIIGAIGGFLGDCWNKGTELMGNLAKGISDFAGDVFDSVSSVVSGAVDGIGDFVGDFIDAGANLMSGLANGISDFAGDVVDNVKDVGGSIVDGVKDFFGIHSPSTVFAEIGKYLDEGLALGITKFSGLAENASSDLGDDTLDGLTDSMSGIDNLFGDMNNNPTITPVLDLSEVQNGTSQLYSMMDGVNGYSINGSTNLANSAINSSTSSLSKDTNLSDTVAKLETAVNALANRPLTQYNTFDIRGDDPTLIANEVSRILQRQVERRDAVWA